MVKGNTHFKPLTEAFYILIGKFGNHTHRVKVQNIHISSIKMTVQNFTKPNRHTNSSGNSAGTVIWFDSNDSTSPSGGC